MVRHTLKILQQSDHFGTLCIKGLICLNPGIQDEKKWDVEPYLS